MSLDQLGAPLVYLDIGAVGGLPGMWDPYHALLHYVALEPNEASCRALAEQPTRFHRADFLPYAAGAEDGEGTLYLTRNDHCCSLLPPNHEWLRRFTVAPLLEVEGEATIAVRRLDGIEALRGLDVDFYKVDSQGLDRAILETSGALLERASLVEAEPGFAENYRGENLFHEVFAYLHALHFCLFDLETHRIPRANALADDPQTRGQILWAEGRYVRDWKAVLQEDESVVFDRSKALRFLLLCAQHRLRDFGLEQAWFFVEKGWLSEEECRALEQPENWTFQGQELEKKGFGKLFGFR